MSFYLKLMESMNTSDLETFLRKNLPDIQDGISSYINLDKDEERSDSLGNILTKLNSCIQQLTIFGYTYTPDTPVDEEENVFQSILSKYSESIDNLLSEYSTEQLESFNVQTRFITSLIDIHRTQYVQEGEVLID